MRGHGSTAHCFSTWIETGEARRAVTMVPVFLIWNSLGQVGTLTPLWAANLFGSAFYIFLIRQFFLGLPPSLFDAAKMDGAGPARTYWSIVLPQLRSALAVAILINIINVFNSLPILKVMTGSIPGYGADTIMTLIFKYIELQKKVDVASALSVVAFLIVIVIVAAYVKIVKPMKEV